MARVIVKFAGSWRGYSKGEIAGFDEDVAQSLIDGERAELVDPKKVKAGSKAKIPASKAGGGEEQPGSASADANAGGGAAGGDGDDTGGNPGADDDKP